MLSLDRHHSDQPRSVQGKIALYPSTRQNMKTRRTKTGTKDGLSGAVNKPRKPLGAEPALRGALKMRRASSSVSWMGVPRASPALTTATVTKQLPVSTAARDRTSAYSAVKDMLGVTN
jgi:hypothetical protein